MQQKENDSSTLVEQSLEHGNKGFASKDLKIATGGVKTTGVLPEYMKIPEPEASNIEFVTSEDRRYFKEHPQARFYDRAPHPSELWPITINTQTTLVRVYQIWPGFRLRCPYPNNNKPSKKAIVFVKYLRKSFKRGDLKAWPLNEGRGNVHGVWAVDQLTGPRREP